MTQSFRILRRTLALACVLTTAHAQQTPDPANLTGEHVAPQSLADTLPINHGAPARQQLLLKLRTRASMMLIVAHPDDEDGGLLTYESRGQGTRVAMLTLTRGEGGQNLMSADFDDALGLIRTQELLAADRYFGVDQFFGTEVDFGFAKTREEAFQKWTHERVLYDAVRAIRLYRPLVIASVFVGGATDGHGHHQVSGQIAQEAFVAAADPKVFPEMGLAPWAPMKVYARVPFSRVTADGMYDYATGRTVPTRFENYVTHQVSTAVPMATVLVHEGDPATVFGKPALGMEGLSYVQFARKGLALQKTQIGPNVRLAPAGRSDAPYKLMASRLCAPSPCTAANEAIEQSLFDGIDTSLPGIAKLDAGTVELRGALEAIDADLGEAQKVFDPEHVLLTAPALLRGLKKLDAVLKTVEDAGFNDRAAKADVLHELRVKRVQLNNALVLAYGMTYEAVASADAASAAMPAAIVSGATVTITSTLDTGAAALRLKGESLPQHKPHVETRTVAVPLKSGADEKNGVGSSVATGPYFSRPDIEQPFYNIARAILRNAPQTPYPFVLRQEVDVDGSTLELDAIASIAGARAQPAVIVPRLSAELSPHVAVVSTHAVKPIDITVKVRSNVEGAKPTLDLGVPPSWVLQGSVQAPTLHAGEESSFHIALTPQGLKPTDSLEKIPSVQVFVFEPEVKGTAETSLGYRSVGYPGLPSTNLYTPATVHVIGVDVTTAPGLRVAYLPGTGDAVPEFLPNLGIVPTTLTISDLNAATLSHYDAVLLGVRAYAAHPELAGTGSQPLLDYAKAGGVVIVQYMTARYGGAEAPYEIEVPGDPAHNVVVEEQPVTLLQPAAPLLNWPNRITAADFNHWVAERGHGFAASWSPSFEALLEMHDPDQDPQRGGLLVAKAGKGAYVYCPLAIYRQLPEGVPGAYRLLANLLSYGKNPKR